MLRRLALLCIAVVAVLSAVPASAQDYQAGPVVVADVRGPLDQRAIDFLAEAVRTEDAQLVVIKIDNVGVAPIYRPYRFAFRLRQGNREELVMLDTDIRTWMPDHTWFRETLTVPRTLQRGEIDVDVGIIDPITRRPAVKLAIDEPCNEGWHLLTRMDIRG